MKAILSVNRDSVLPSLIRTVVNDDSAGVFATSSLTNIFGGAESLTIEAAIDSSPKAVSSYSANFTTPINGSPDLSAQISGFQIAQTNSWASHSTANVGAVAQFVSRSAIYPGSSFHVGAEAIQRNVTSVSEDSSEAVRALEGQVSNKTSVRAGFTIDRRNIPSIYSTEGYLVKVDSELAGVIGNSAIPSDVSYLKTEGSASFSKSLDPANDNLVFNVNVGSGLLWTYNNKANERSSSIFDRFFLGGRNGSTVARLYGYQFNGIGPKDGFDSVGGDAYTLGSISFLGKLPRLASSTLSPLRFLLFFSGASLVPVSSESGSFKNTLRDAISSPSTCAGAGLVYVTPYAQMELTYSAPLRFREDDWTRKGLQLGAGLQFNF